MATGKTCFPRQNYRFLPSDLTAVSSADAALELDESEVYFSAISRSDSPELRRPARSACSAWKLSRKYGDRIERPRAAPSSLPVNIPDWSKILRDEYRDCSRRRGDNLENDLDDSEDEAEDGGAGSRLPPHEFLARQMARTRIGSFSVREGVGGILKGRELNRVRNAVWARIGFQD